MFSKAILAAALIAMPAIAGATTILDGSFELKGANGRVAGVNPTTAAGAITTFCYDTGNSRKCAGGAWVGGGIIRDGATPFGGTSSPEGNFYAFVQGGSSISQTFVATGRQTGVLSWIDTNRTSTNAALRNPKSYIVTLSEGVNSTTIASFTSTIGPWVARTSSIFDLFPGVAYTLTFRGVAPTGDRTVFIDGVSLATTTVPEAATWAMLLIGFGIVGFAARRRRIAVAA